MKEIIKTLMSPSSKKNVLKKLVAKPIIFNKIVGKNTVKKVPEAEINIVSKKPLLTR